MNTVATLPCRSPHVIIGPPEYVGGHVLRFAKHRVSGVYYRFGEREAFLLDHLDGSRDFDTLASAYHAAFGVRLAPGSLHNAVSLFTRRGLVEGVAAPVAASDSLRLGPQENALNFRFYYWNPDVAMGRLAERFHWLVNPRVFLAWGLFLVLAELALLPHAGQLWNEALRFEGYTVWLRAAALLVIYFGVTLLHEAGHAIACKRYGGEVREMGVMLRYFIFAAYTRLDDILLFHDRGRRIQALAAGPLVSFSLIPIAFVGWLLAPHDSVLRMVMVDILVWFNIACLLQMLPFLQSDGYFMMAQMLRMPDLRKDASAYLFGWVLAHACGRRMPPMPKGAARHLVPVYVAYGMLSFGVTTAAIAYVVHHHAQLILRLAGETLGHVAMVVLGLLLIWNLAFSFVPWARRQHARLLH